MSERLLEIARDLEYEVKMLNATHPRARGIASRIAARVQWLREEAEQDGLLIPEAADAFEVWFAENYPGPQTIIGDPHWHAPKIFRAAVRCIDAARSVSVLSVRRDGDSA